MLGKTWRPSGTWITRACAIARGEAPEMSLPSRVMVPVFFTTPEIAFRVVVLPAPLAPMMQQIVPSRTSREMPFRASIEP